MSTIDWEALRKRMLIMKYQPGYFSTSTPVIDGWILAYGTWNDDGEWQDDDVWKDS